MAAGNIIIIFFLRDCFNNGAVMEKFAARRLKIEASLRSVVAGVAVKGD